MSAIAFRPAWFDGREYRAAHYAYRAAEAATQAVPVLNKARSRRQEPPYTHVVAFRGEEVAEIRALADPS